MMVIGWDTGSGHVGRCKLEVTRASAVYVFADEISVGHKVLLKKPRTRKGGAVQTEERVIDENDIAQFAGIARQYLGLCVDCQDLCADEHEHRAMCAIERRSRVFPTKGRMVSAELASQLKTADWLGGEVAGAARGYGYRVTQASADEWRKALCGNAHATDKMVSDAIALAIDGWPKRSNPHMRDAAGVALYCARREMGRRGEQAAEVARVTRELSTIEKLRAFEVKHPRTCSIYDGVGCSREPGCVVEDGACSRCGKNPCERRADCFAY